jgi:lipopolysaccharide transport system ATP-binding protein
MSQNAIELEKIGKQYHIGKRRVAQGSVGTRVSEAFVSPFRRAAKLLAGRATGAADLDETFWALKNVSLAIKHGEVVGLIGRNGAGKSTLLKILSRITEPTEGQGEINGRVGSLLEVGTGFHPELTGRENLFLNGAILGMQRAEIQRKFDEIVAFAEIDKFIDTPVKHYSSGMYVRLAFAVAAHLEPEVLLVDEVLAVGDAAFQKKCLRKMTEISQAGLTVVFVSHNMAAVENLCNKGILIEDGTVTYCGAMSRAVERYLQGGPDQPSARSHIIDLTNAPGRPRQCRPMLKRLELFTDQGRALNGSLPMGSSLIAHIYCEIEEPTSRVDAGLGFDSLLGQRIFTADTMFEPQRAWGSRSGEQVFICEIPSLTLVPGEYKIKVALNIRNCEDWVEDAVRLTVAQSDYYGTGVLPWSGTCVMKQRWALASTDELEGIRLRD